MSHMGDGYRDTVVARLGPATFEPREQVPEQALVRTLKPCDWDAKRVPRLLVCSNRDLNMGKMRKYLEKL